MGVVNPKLRAFSFVNRADPKGVDNREVGELLKESSVLTYIDKPLINRKAFANSITFGLGILELKPADEKAIAEFVALYNAVFMALNIKPF
jgi:chromosome partitioning protein